MILIGMFDSPFVRRVAVSMNLLGIPFEHRNWSVGREFELIRQFNPLGRVPALVDADGETLIESSAILDFLDQAAGPERALLPLSGELRREALHIIAIAAGAAEKGVTQVDETAFRPPEKRYRPWVERCHAQMHGALGELDRLCQVRGDEWLIGNRITQADITAACVYTYLSDALDLNRDTAAYPALGAVTARCEALPEFKSAKADWFAPGQT
ncbi:MAG TPA: glutathione S-transferase family protein [Steroidobacteraceae bacterium]|jgi:glutathione S-transferase|nr:glutathione S-transferase family protein [Steroidobacteraceae bacterium]